MIIEHLNSQVNLFLKIDDILIWIMALSFHTNFGINCPPLHKIGAWEFHSDICLPDEAFETRDIN